MRGTIRLWVRELCEGMVNHRLGESQLGDRKSSDGGRALAVTVEDSVEGHGVESEERSVYTLPTKDGRHMAAGSWMKRLEHSLSAHHLYGFKFWLLTKSQFPRSLIFLAIKASHLLFPLFPPPLLHTHRDKTDKMDSGLSSCYILHAFFIIFNSFSSPFLPFIPFHSTNLHSTTSHSFPFISPPLPQDVQTNGKTMKKIFD